MNDFEVLSRDAAELGEPVEPKRDAETPEEPETVRRVRAGLDALTAELAEAKEAVAYLKARENELLAEKAELARSLAASKKDVAATTQAWDATAAEFTRYVDEQIKESLELFRKFRDAKDAAARFQAALDAARNDVAIYRRAAFWFAVSLLLAVVVALVAIF
jgi:chromosome segregation ATPase